MQMRPPRNHFGDPEKGSHCDIVAARHAWRQRHSYGKHTCFRLKRAAQKSVANHINLHSGFLFISSVFFHTELVSGCSKRGDDVTIGLALGSTLGPLWDPISASFCPFGSTLGPSPAQGGPCWAFHANLGPFLVILGSSWETLGALLVCSWADCGGGPDPDQTAWGLHFVQGCAKNHRKGVEKSTWDSLGGLFRFG